ncbi:MAG: DUF5081 family protein [Thomasclavelia sp.]|nr:DUF5081 family protein [Thomasclavelia sp.]
MDISILEMNFLCQILDKTSLYGFESFSMLTSNQAQEVKNSLYKKDILDENYSLTNKGLKILEVLELYVNAQEFLKFGKNSIFAKYQESEYVLITKLENTFSINLVNQDQIVVIILSKFDNWDTLTNTDHKKRLLLGNKFVEFMNNNADLKAIFLLRVNIENNLESNIVMYINDGYFNCFDAKSKQLDMYSRNDVQQAITDVISSDWGIN